MKRGKFLLVPDIAERLQRSKAAVRWQIHTGALPTVKIAGRVGIFESDYNAWIDEQVEKASA